MELYRAQLGTGTSSSESTIISNDSTSTSSSSIDKNSDTVLDNRLSAHPSKELNEEKRKSARRKE